MTALRHQSVTAFAEVAAHDRDFKGLSGDYLKYPKQAR